MDSLEQTLATVHDLLRAERLEGERPADPPCHPLMGS